MAPPVRLGSPLLPYITLCKLRSRCRLYTGLGTSASGVFINGLRFCKQMGSGSKHQIWTRPNGDGEGTRTPDLQRDRLAFYATELRHHRDATYLCTDGVANHPLFMISLAT